MESPVICTLTSSDGQCLHFRHWVARSNCQGAIVALHGIQSHSGWYEYSSRRLAEAGFDVYFADRRGSGKNMVQRGHADHGMRLLNDVRQLVRRVRREHPNVPVTLLGLSWGGKTAAAFAAVYPEIADRLVLLYPGLKPVIRPTLWQSFQLNFARRHDLRHHPVEIPLKEPALFTSSAEWQAFIRRDPLALRVVTSGFLNAGRDLDEMIRLQGHRITVPVLLMLAGRDQIIDNHQTQRCVAGFSSTSVNTIVYPDAQHTLEFEQVRDQFVSDLLEWLMVTVVSGQPA